MFANPADIRPPVIKPHPIAVIRRSPLQFTVQGVSGSQQIVEQIPILFVLEQGQKLFGLLWREADAAQVDCAIAG